MPHKYLLQAQAFEHKGTETLLATLNADAKDLVDVLHPDFMQVLVEDLTANGLTQGFACLWNAMGDEQRTHLRPNVVIKAVANTHRKPELNERRWRICEIIKATDSSVWKSFVSRPELVPHTSKTLVNSPRPEGRGFTVSRPHTASGA